MLVLWSACCSVSERAVLRNVNLVDFFCKDFVKNRVFALRTYSTYVAVIGGIKLIVLQFNAIEVQ